jgi:predicted GIY-YIG superfamily endonuclease
MKQPKDGYYTVYLIPLEWYVGYTGEVKRRLSEHKNEFKRDISNWVVLAEVETKQEAIEIEYHYHSIGYKGKREIDYEKISDKIDYVSRNSKIDFKSFQERRIKNTDWVNSRIKAVKNTDYGLRSLKFNKPILQFNKNGEFIKEFESIKVAQNEFTKNGGNISMCLSGKTKTAYGFKWEYKK